jgi:hypothetical protein
MRYFLLIPQTETPGWAVDKKVTLGFFASGHALVYCEGVEPPYGATYVNIKGETGEVAYWPVASAPPNEIRGLLLQEEQVTPATGEEATQ